MVPRSSNRAAGFLLFVAQLLVPATAKAQDVRVTVVTILATDKNTNTDPKLKDLAHDVKTREPSLTGFRIGKTSHRDISIGQKEAIKLFDDKDYSADVKLIAKDDSNKRVELEIKPPTVGAITYKTAYDKYFPIVTRAVVDGERLIIAVMVKPAEKSAKAGQ
jgi:hypothetical protein